MINLYFKKFKPVHYFFIVFLILYPFLIFKPESPYLAFRRMYENKQYSMLAQHAPFLKKRFTDLQPYISFYEAKSYLAMNQQQKAIFAEDVWIIFTYRNKTLIGRTMISPEGVECVLSVSETKQVALLRFDMCEYPHILSVEKHEQKIKEKIEENKKSMRIKNSFMQGKFDKMYFN